MAEFRFRVMKTLYYTKKKKKIKPIIKLKNCPDRRLGNYGKPNYFRNLKKNKNKIAKSTKDCAQIPVKSGCKDSTGCKRYDLSHVENPATTRTV